MKPTRTHLFLYGPNIFANEIVVSPGEISPKEIRKSVRFWLLDKHVADIEIRLFFMHPEKYWYQEKLLELLLS